MTRRPTLGRAIFRTGTKCQNRFIRRQTMFCQSGLTAFGINRETGIIGIPVKIRLGRMRQRSIAVNHQRQRGLIQLADIVQQKIARLADVARTLLDARSQGNDGGFERTGQNNHLIIAFFSQFTPDTPAFFQFQRTMSKRIFHHTVDFRHTLKYGHRPFGRKGINGAAGMQLMQTAIKRLGHDAVTNPAWGNNQDFFGHNGMCF